MSYKITIESSGDFTHATNPLTNEDEDELRIHLEDVFHFYGLKIDYLRIEPVGEM